MRLHLYKRGLVWWARGSDGGVKFRKSTKHQVKSKAELVRDRWERELADPTHFRAHQATVESAANRWLREIKKAKKPPTYRFYEQKIQHVMRLLGDKRLAQIDHERVLKYIEDREAEGSHPHSIHRELTALRLTLKSAIRAKEFGQNPKDVIPIYATGYVPRKEWVTPEHIWAVIAELPTARAAAVAIVAATACDFSTIPEFTRADIHPEVVKVRGTKTTTRNREVPRGVPVFERFLAFALLHGRSDGPMFGAWSNMPRDVRAACRRAGVPEFTARTLRRSAATWMVNAGVPYELAAKFLGHGSTAMLQKVYGQLAPAAAGRLISEAFASSLVPVVYPAPPKTPDSADDADSRNTEKHDV